MDTNNTEEIKKKIEEEYNNNCSKINDLNTKIWLIQRSGFEMKFGSASALSIIPWIATMFIWPSILNLGVIPLELTKPLFIAVPALIGTTVSSIIHRKQKINERVKEFSTSKTAREKLEEETRYKIEQEKLKSYNKMLKKYYDDLESNEKLFSSLSKKYNITAKEKDTRNKEEIQENIENVEKLLAESKDNMDITTTRYTLKRLFWKVRNKHDKYDDAFVCGCLGTIFGMMLYNMPMFMADSLESVQFSTSLIGIYAPAIIVGSSCIGYGVKRTKDRLHVFKKINNELGENAIPEVKKINTEENYEQERNKVINDTCTIRMQLDSERQKLETLKTDSEKTIEADYQIPKLTQQPVGEIRKYYLDGEFERTSDEVLARELPQGEIQCKKRTLVPRKDK